MASRFLYLINPKPDLPVYYGAEVFTGLGLPPAAFVADLTTTTVAALVPTDFTVEICDESIAPADLDHPAEFIGITGKTSQRRRMIELAGEFRKRGKTVLFGGPYATLSSDAARKHCDILVRGELEGVASHLFDDLRSGDFRTEYLGSREDLSITPVPRWDLYPTDRALQGCLQTSRGCPYHCDFCDTIQYVGRRKRHKPIPRVLAELDVLYRKGFRTVFLADDNFTAHRPRAQELLGVLAGWNDRVPEGSVHFSTQMSIDAADHPELLALCSRAGLSEAFVGIESFNPASLRECGKEQNLGADPVERVECFVSRGVGVIGGLVIGFDADDSDVFGRHYELAMKMPVPTFSVNALNAPPSTPLYGRMKREGRLLPEEDTTGPMAPWWTNILPARIPPGELRQGIRELLRRLYRPAAFEKRMQRFMGLVPESAPDRRSGHSRREVSMAAVSVVRAVARLGDEEREMYIRLLAAAQERPSLKRHLFANLFRYVQIRMLCDRTEDSEDRTRRA